MLEEHPGIQQRLECPLVNLPGAIHYPRIEPAEAFEQPVLVPRLPGGGRCPEKRLERGAWPVGQEHRQARRRTYVRPVRIPALLFIEVVVVPAGIEERPHLCGRSASTERFIFAGMRLSCA